MSHEAIESFAIHPHNTESARVESLIPEQLRGNASNLITLLQEYYDYMNIDGVTNSLGFINTTSGDELSYEDIKESNVKLGLNVAGFVPSTYNQQYVQLTQEELDAGNYSASIVYRGLTRPEYYIMRVDTTSAGIINTWVMASIIDGKTKVDFYDKDWQIDPIGSKLENLENIIWQENTSGTLDSPSLNVSAAYSTGSINALAMTIALQPRETTLIDFTDIPTQGGNGQGLTLDIVVDKGQVVSVAPNKPGFGYRIDDVIETAILSNTIFTITDVIASPTNVIQRILEEHDIDKTTDDYLGRISKEIAKGIPNAKNLDKNVLYKKIVEYYNTRGSEVSVESFFKIFFDEIASVFYPKDVLFKASDGIYQGTADVSDTLEKYFYKKGYEKYRRIQFYRDALYDDTRSGTYFIDFKFGTNFRKNVTPPTSITDSNHQAAHKQTILFSMANVAEQQSDELQLKTARNGSISLQIDDEGKLIINGRFGIGNTFTKTIGTTSEPFVTGTNEFPFQEVANLARQRIRLALTIEAEKNSTNEISSSSGTYKIGAIKLSLTDSGVTDNEPQSITPANDGSDIDLLGKMSVYPSMLGYGLNDNSVGDFGETGVSPDGEIYFYQFAFFNRICTDTEIKNFVNVNSLPSLNKIINIKIDNNGSVNFTNISQSNIIATSLEGEATGNSTLPIVETNFGLSATGTSYPRTFSWAGTKGFLSEGNKLHDSNYYQEFSYVIRTNLSVERWDTDYNKLIHPSGLKFFAALYLELASLRSKDSEPLVINIADGVRRWLSAIQQTVEKGQHSPKWQPGWIEYFFNVLLEIILYEKFSAFYKTTQPNINTKKDIFYDHESGLRIRQLDDAGNEASDNSTGFTIKGNAQNLILNSINSLSYEQKYITLDGNGTGIRTGARIDESSNIELTFKPLEGGTGKYIAGTTWKGEDGYEREVSIKQLANLSPNIGQAEVMVTDNGATTSSAYKEEVLTFKVIGDQLDNNSGKAGVEFSDDTITIDTSISNQSMTATDAATRKGFVGVKRRGHNLVVLDPSTKKYSVFSFDTYGGSQSLPTGHSTPAEAEEALVTKISSITGNKIIIVYTWDASGCSLGTGKLREWIKDNKTSSYVGSNTWNIDSIQGGYSVDRRSTWTPRRFGHVFVTTPSGNRIYENMQPLFGGHNTDANRNARAAELSLRYKSDGTIVGMHPHIDNGERGTIFKPLLRGAPVKVTLSLNDYTTLKIGSDGSVEQKNSSSDVYGIARSKLEASDPIYIPKIECTTTDWSPYIRTKTLNDPATKGSTGMFWHDGYKGMVATGNSLWTLVDFKIPIKDENTTYNLSLDVQSFINNNKIYVGTVSYNASGQYLGTDIRDTYNYTFIKTLDTGATESIEVSLGGINPKRNNRLLRSAHPRVISYENQDTSSNSLFTTSAGEDAIYPYDFIEHPISQATTSSNKFDPEAKFFSIVLISNYQNNLIDNYNEATLFKNLKIERADGLPIANSAIQKYDSQFGIKNISTTSLPVVQTTTSDTPASHQNYFTNNTFPNTLAIGTLVKDSKLAGVHPNHQGSRVEEYQPVLDTNLFTKFNQLPWRPGTGDFTVGSLNGTVPANSVLLNDTTNWKATGTITDNKSTSEIYREFRTGPFNNTELVSVLSGANTPSILSPGVNITNLDGVGHHTRDDFRYIIFFKFGSTPPQFNVGVKHKTSTGAGLGYINKSTQTGSEPAIETGDFNLPGNEWFMLVGYVTNTSKNANSGALGTSTNNIGDNGRYLRNKNILEDSNNKFRDYTDQGIYSISSGTRVSTNIGEFALAHDDDRTSAENTYLQISMELASTGEVEIAQPRIDVVNPNMPSVSQLLHNDVLPHEGLKYPSAIQLSDVYVSGKNDKNNIKYLITETDLTGITFDRINNSPSAIPTTESSTTYTNPVVKGAKEFITLKNQLALGGDDGLVLKGTNVNSLQALIFTNRNALNTSGNNHFLLRNLGGGTTDFTVIDVNGNDVTERRSGTDIIYRQDVVNNRSYGHIELVGNQLGYDEGDEIRIDDSKIGGLGLSNYKIRVNDVGAGVITSKHNALANLTNDNPFYLTRNIKVSSNSPINLGEGGAYVEDDFKWEKDKAYEISFTATKINDKNKPANLFIGSEKIGSFIGIDRGTINFGIGNPNANLLSTSSNGDKGTDGYGPKELTFNSSIEGLCRIYFYAGDVEGAWYLAHNGHQLRVDDTNQDVIHRVRTPIDYYKTDSTVIKPQLDNNNRQTSLNSIDDIYSLFVFESEYLTIGENTIQIYHQAQGDGLSGGGAFVKVEPLDNGLITEGENVHKIYIPANSTDPKILIDHIVDRNVSRLTGNAAYNGLVSDLERLYEYNWKIENVVVREKRKRVYQGNFQCIVNDDNLSSTTFVGGNNTHPQFETLFYRPTDVESYAATDGAHKFGGDLRVPALLDRASPSDGADVGQQYVNQTGGGTVPLLGIPKGKYGSLKFTANSVGLHYISIGDEVGGFGIGQLYTPGEIYEVSGKVFIPTSNSKIEQVHIIAGVNPRATDEDTGQFINDASGNPTFKNQVGEFQIMTGDIAGYDVYGSDPQAITTKGSWVSFKHKFIAPSIQSDPRPVVRFLSTMKGVAIRGHAGYTGDASGEYFYIKDINIKEGYDSDIVKFKDEIDERRETIIDLDDQVDYDVKLNTLKTNDEACIAIDVKHPADTNNYNVKYNQNTNLGDFDLNALPLIESNLLGANLPFTIGTGDNNNFEALGNPISASQSSSSPYATTQENIQKRDKTPFGDTDILWQAQNKDGAWARLDSTQIVTSNAGAGYHQLYTNPTYVLSEITHTNPTFTTNGSGINAQFTVTRTNGVYSVNITNGGSGYAAGDQITVLGEHLGGITGQNNLIFNIPVAGYDSPTSGVINSNFAITDIFGTASTGNAQFKIKRQGTAYTIDFTGGSPGIGFSATDTLTIKGSQLGGADTTNDLVITIDSVSSGGISTTSLSGTADAIFENIEIEDIQTGNAGVGAKASITINNSGTITNLALTDAGVNYGKQSNNTYTSSTFTIRLKSDTFVTSGTAFDGTAKIVSGTIGSNNKVLSFSDGGFKSPQVTIDTDKTYRCSVWVKASDNTYSAGQVPYDSTNGGLKQFRWKGFSEDGTTAQEAINITSGNETQNPTFYSDFDLGLSNSSPAAPAENPNNKNQWFLFVGHIRPFDHIGNTDHPDSGIYLPSRTTPLKVRALNSVSSASPYAPSGSFRGDWKFNSAMRKINFTVLQNANPTDSEHPIQYYAPRVDEINGLEPTIRDLTSGDVRYKLQANDYEKKINIINWKTPLLSANESIGDYTHIIEGNDFAVTIDEIKNKIEYADEINGELINTGAPEDTLIEVEIPASGGTNMGCLVLPFMTASGYTVSHDHAFSIDWGDGTSNFVTSTNDRDLFHKYTQYSDARRYTIKIRGSYHVFDISLRNSAGPSSGFTQAGVSVSTAQLSQGRTNAVTYIRKFYLGSNPITSGTGNYGQSPLRFKDMTYLEEFISVKGVTNTTGLKGMTQMFSGCNRLKHLDLRGFDTSLILSFNQTFRNMGTIEVDGKTGVDVIGFHKLDISSLAQSQNVDEIDFTGTTFNSDELSRCYTAWGNNTYGITPSSTFSGNASGTVAGPAVTGKIGRLTFKRSSSGTSAIFTIKDTSIGPVKMMSTGATNTNLAAGMTVTSNASGFPTGTITITKAGTGGVILSSAPTGTMGQGSLFTVVPQIGENTLAIRNMTGTLRVGMKVSGVSSAAQAAIPSNTTIASIITLQLNSALNTGSNDHSTIALVTLSNNFTAIPPNNNQLQFTDNVIRLSSAPTGTIQVGQTANNGGGLVTDASDQQNPVVTNFINLGTGAAVTFTSSTAQQLVFNMGSTKFFNPSTLDSPNDSSPTNKVVGAKSTLTTTNKIQITDGGIDSGTFDF